MGLFFGVGMISVGLGCTSSSEPFCVGAATDVLLGVRLQRGISVGLLGGLRGGMSVGLGISVGLLGALCGVRLGGGMSVGLLNLLCGGRLGRHSASDVSEASCFGTDVLEAFCFGRCLQGDVSLGV